MSTERGTPNDHVLATALDDAFGQGTAERAGVVKPLAPCPHCQDPDPPQVLELDPVDKTMLLGMCCFQRDSELPALIQTDAFKVWFQRLSPDDPDTLRLEDDGYLVWGPPDTERGAR